MMTREEVAQATGPGLEEAGMAKEREFSETVVEADTPSTTPFGVHCQHGGARV